MRYFKTATAAFLVLAAASLASTAQPGQSHNLSEIDPVDVDLNMSDYGVFNASQYELRNGLNFSGYSVYDQGNVEILRYDEENSEWDIKNSGLDLEGGVLKDSLDAAMTLNNSVDINGSLDVSTDAYTLGRFERTDADNQAVYIQGSSGSSIQFGRSGGGGWIKDTNGDRVIWFRDNGEIEIPNGDLDINNSQINNLNQLNFNGNAFIDEGTQDYGSIRVANGCQSGWCGVNIQGQSDYVFMTDADGDDVGVYDDDNNNWVWRWDASDNSIDFEQSANKMELPQYSGNPSNRETGDIWYDTSAD